MKGAIMTEFVFNLLESIGFHHPIHPVVTHLPMGMIMGGLLFGMASYFLKKPELARTALYCSVLALIGVFPTVLFGYMDWQHSYEGEWMFLIKLKMVLAAVLVGLLAACVKVNSKNDSVTTAGLTLYILCMLTAIGLGYSGGELLFG
jgi:uncharacterized membrane protein